MIGIVPSMMTHMDTIKHQNMAMGNALTASQSDSSWATSVAALAAASTLAETMGSSTCSAWMAASYFFSALIFAFVQPDM